MNARPRALPGALRGSPCACLGGACGYRLRLRPDIEGVELDLIIMPARVQAVEVRSAVYAQKDRLSVDHERRTVS